MTEAQAYEKLGWAPEGGAPNLFVLPMANQGGSWFVTRCEPCHMDGVIREEFFLESGGQCHICGNLMHVIK